MTRRFITVILRFALRIFFRRVEVAGLERVPRRGATIFVLNHQNGLVDPAFLLCYAPRPVSFLAKSTLFRTPVLGFLVRALDAIPVYRKQDAGQDTSKNRETFTRAHNLLKSGGTIGVCPEGVSHNESSLRPLKSGTARIALGAASTGDALDLKIVPAGLYYTAKTMFRSSALLYFGEPVRVEPVTLDADDEPPREAVQELSEHIARALREATLNAEHHEALTTVARAERIFSSDDGVAAASGGQTLSREMKLKRRFVEGYAFHRANSPARLAALEARIRGYEEELAQAGVDIDHLSPVNLSKYGGVGHLVTRGLLFLLLLPLAVFGAAVHYPAYRLGGFFATKFSRSYDDIVSTIKVISALLLFPLTWLVIMATCFVFGGWQAALVSLVVAPLAGYVAMRFAEELDRFVAGTKAAAFFITERRFFRQLLVERRAIREEIFALGEEAERAGALQTTV
ncbi:MAG: lysophospholipid acyltransferase family protein [Acidobacteriota bacterium]|nr:lysophospholipid acyltransferase family protein [Acidobacteriota bacterium]